MRYVYSNLTGVRKIRAKWRALITGGAAGISALVVSVMTLLSPVGAAPAVVYDNIPTPQPGNVSSQAFEATSTSEFGGQVQLAGTDRQNLQATVLMSSWGCQSGSWFGNNCVTTPGATFSEPITLNVHAVGAGNTVGSLLYTTTQTFNIPYRPSASPSCTGADAGKWSDGTTCYNGFATPITFNTSTTWPNNAIVSVAYNTTHYGATPYGESTACFGSSGGCGYDSLNVGLNYPPTAGTVPNPSDAYLNSTWAGAYCDNGVSGTGTFRLDSGCWSGYQPAFRITAASTSPTSADQCKNNGWKTFNSPAFKNQGDCVSWVQHNVNGNGTPAQNR